MKKIVCTAGILLSALCITACGIPQIREMSEEQEKLVTEYAAGLLIKYDPSAKSNLLDEEQLAKAEEEERIQREKDERTKQLAEEYVAKQQAAEAEKQKKKDANKKDKNGQSGETKNEIAVIPSDGIGQFLDLGVEVSIDDYSVTKSYVQQGNEAFAVDASNGKELLIFDVKVSNNSDTVKNLDMFSNGAKFTLTLNNGKTIEKCSTLLLNDFSIYRGDIETNKSEDMILLFEVDEGTQVDSAQIGLSGANGAGIISIK